MVWPRSEKMFELHFLEISFYLSHCTQLFSTSHHVLCCAIWEYPCWQGVGCIRGVHSKCGSTRPHSSVMITVIFFTPSPSYNRNCHEWKYWQWWTTPKINVVGAICRGEISSSILGTKSVMYTLDLEDYRQSLSLTSYHMYTFTSIFISEESVSVLVCYSVTASPAQTVGSIRQIICVINIFPYIFPFPFESPSLVQCQNQNFTGWPFCT